MRRTLTAFLFFGVAACTHAVVIATWTFETSIPATAGPFAAESGVGQALGSHAGAAVYSSPSGNGSAHSFSSNTWAIGDYYQFSVSTVGLGSVFIGWDQTSSNTGPRDFQLAYSNDGVNFFNFGSVYSVLPNAAPNNWNSTTYLAVHHFSVDMSSASALNNQNTIYLRLVDASNVSANGGTVASGGTDRVDNFFVEAMPVPEPTSIAVLAIGAVALFARRRRS